MCKPVLNELQIKRYLQTVKTLLEARLDDYKILILSASDTKWLYKMPIKVQHST